jgi:hypothetical protein
VQGPGKIDPLEMAMRRIETTAAHLPQRDRLVLEEIKHTKKALIVHLPDLSLLLLHLPFFFVPDLPSQELSDL